VVVLFGVRGAGGNVVVVELTVLPSMGFKAQLSRACGLDAKTMEAKRARAKMKRLSMLLVLHGRDVR
jgi:hypothetical protein